MTAPFPPERRAVVTAQPWDAPALLEGARWCRAVAAADRMAATGWRWQTAVAAEWVQLAVYLEGYADALLDAQP